MNFGDTLPIDFEKLNRQQMLLQGQFESAIGVPMAPPAAAAEATVPATVAELTAAGIPKDTPET
eukprot:9262985-Alexandrium_andersonii.AAC.1